MRAQRRLHRAAARRARAARRRQLDAALAALHEQHGLREALANAWRLHWVLAERARAGGGRAVLLDHRLDERARRRTRSRDAIDRRGARALAALSAAAGRARRRRCCWPTRGGRGRSRSSAARSACRRATRPIRACCSRIAVPLMFGYMFGDVGQGLVIALGGFVLRRRLAAGPAVHGRRSRRRAVRVPVRQRVQHARAARLVGRAAAGPAAVLLVPLAGGGAAADRRARAARRRGALARRLRWSGSRPTRASSPCTWACSCACCGRRAAGRGGRGRRSTALGHAWHARRPGGRRGGARRARRAHAADPDQHAVVRARRRVRARARRAVVGDRRADGRRAKAPCSRGSCSSSATSSCIVLEGLVVSIQTTRLVLFEFFTRFLVAEGRVFRPLPPPPFHPAGESHMKPSIKFVAALVARHAGAGALARPRSSSRRRLRSPRRRRRASRRRRKARGASASPPRRCPRRWPRWAPASRWPRSAPPRSARWPRSRSSSAGC